MVPSDLIEKHEQDRKSIEAVSKREDLLTLCWFRNDQVLGPIQACILNVLWMSGNSEQPSIFGLLREDTSIYTVGCK